MRLKILGVVAAIILLLAAGPLLASGPQTAWPNPARLGAQGVAVCLVERPEGGFLIYWMAHQQGLAAASSADGLVWNNEESFFLPELSPGEMRSNPWVFLNLAGQYRMIYEIRDQVGNRRFYSAVSDDGLNFRTEGLVMAGEPEDLSPQGTVFLSVPDGLRLDDGNLRMYFVSDGSSIRSAVSADDGLTWVRDPGVRASDRVDPAILALPNGGYRLFCVEFGFGPQQARHIYYADAADGLNFTFQEEVASSPEPDQLTLDPEIIRPAQGNCRLYFSYGPTEGPGDIYCATAPDTWSLELYPVVRPERGLK